MMRCSLLTLLLCCSAALARDPFRPVADRLCQPPAAPLTGWRLQGIIGREARFRVWLLTPQGQSVPLRVGQSLALSPWQLTGINWRSIRLTVSNSCSTQSTSFHLKGGSHEKDRNAVADSERPDAGLRRSTTVP